MLEPITIELLVHAPVEHCWNAWNNPDEIKKWNVPFEDWHCPVAENDPT
ncbi:MAG: activator of HSP90 ATPase, partial [Chitinophagaceae bacterium]